MGKATESQLATLHGKVAEVMTAALDQSDRAANLLDKYRSESFKEGDKLPADILRFLEDTKEVNPSLLTSATKFLKDNNISCDASEDSRVSELQEKLRNKRKGTVTSITFD